MLVHEIFLHGGTSPGAPKSNGHALKHGRYTAEAIAEQREFAAIVRDMKGLVFLPEADLRTRFALGFASSHPVQLGSQPCEYCFLAWTTERFALRDG
jgi:hypothetical protein